MRPLQQLLLDQPPTTSGAHEAMVRHAEGIFDEFKGIFPLFLGKRSLGPFINLPIPKEATASREVLEALVRDLVDCYSLRMVSVLSAVRTRSGESESPRLGAALVTADSAKAYFQTVWRLEFDALADLAVYARSTDAGPVVDETAWRSFLDPKRDAPPSDEAFSRLVPLFGSANELPQP